jgi:hypothetical protein
MNIGEMQRLLSVKAEKEPNHQFDDLYGLLCNKDWLGLAHDHVKQNAGSMTAGCNGMDKEGKFQPYPVRRVYILKASRKLRPLMSRMTLSGFGVFHHAAVRVLPCRFIPASVVPSLLHERMLLVWLSSRRLCHGDSVDNAKGLHGHVSQP